MYNDFDFDKDIIMDFYKWFFMEEGRTKVTFFSFGHIFFVTMWLSVFLGLAVLLSWKFKKKDKITNLIILIAGCLIVTVEIAKLVWLYLEYQDTHTFASLIDSLVGNAPLYLCDMMIFVIPLCALTKGRFRGWCLDFVAIWGLLMGFLGTYFDGNTFGGQHALFSYWTLITMLNHCTSAFTALFIILCGLNKMEKRDIPYVVGMLFVFMTIALTVDYADRHNFMFFFSGSGTPFILFQQLAGLVTGTANYPPAEILFKPTAANIVYQLFVIMLQSGYMVGFYFAFCGFRNLHYKKHPKQEEAVEQAA